MRQNQLKINDWVQEYQGEYQSYQADPQQYGSSIIEGFFPKENIRKEMAIRKINTTLTVLLGVFLVFTAISYYFATANEMVLNNLSRQTTVLNDENSDLQNKIDKLKSFNNVDITMQKNNTLKKAQQVLEVPAVSTNIITDKKSDAEKPFTWAIGY
ncbi:MAG: hypothetical protein PHC64_09755 [Candidatus Gastranaerophilales bacterium]|nr:hypothetical protein [Candidatus Gastranaerophilales bacterium]